MAKENPDTASAKKTPDRGDFYIAVLLAASIPLGMAIMDAREKTEDVVKEVEVPESGEITDEMIAARFNVKEAPLEMDEKTRAKKRKKAERKKGKFDEVTGNVLTKSAEAALDSGKYPGPRVVFTVNSREFAGRHSCVMKVLRGVMEFERGHGTGRELDMTWGIRTNEEQEKINSDSYDPAHDPDCKPGFWSKLRHPLKCTKTGRKHALDRQAYAAADAYSGLHLFGCTFDIGSGTDEAGNSDPKLIDWEEIQPYLEAHGFIGGFKNGISRANNGNPITDPYHFTIQEEIRTPADEARQAELRAIYCRANAAHCQAMEARKKTMDAMKKSEPVRPGSSRAPQSQPSTAPEATKKGSKNPWQSGGNGKAGQTNVWK